MDNFQAHILVVDDDEGIRSLVKKYLNEKKYLVTTADNAENASEKIKVIKFDLIILDIMMPGKSGLDFLKEHKEYINTPIILLTAKGEPNERIEGLELGADDYLTKPFDSEVLLAKIKSILGRRMIKEVADTVETQFKIGNFNLNTKLRLLSYLDQNPIKLSPKENQLLRLLAIHINDLLPRDQALSKIWRDDNYFTSRSMDVYIAKLRKYLKKDGLLFQKFHQEDWKGKFAMIDKFKDERMITFAHSLIFNEAPEILPKEIHKKIKRRIASRILSTNKEKWWTVSAFYSECDEIRENEDKMFSFKTVDEKLKFLDGINDYVMNLEQKYSDA